MTVFRSDQKIYFSNIHDRWNLEAFDQIEQLVDACFFLPSSFFITWSKYSVRSWASRPICRTWHLCGGSIRLSRQRYSLILKSESHTILLDQMVKLQDWLWMAIRPSRCLSLKWPPPTFQHTASVISSQISSHNRLSELDIIYEDPLNAWTASTSESQPYQ